MAESGNRWDPARQLERITADLNPTQLDVVTAPLGNMLVLAGAGSGKTRVLVHRIAYLVAAHGVSPFGLVSVTFTNKAAGEMRHRAMQLLEMENSGLWISTFHSIAYRILRQHWQEAGLPQAFEILDSGDQLRIIKRLMTELKLSDATYQPREFQNYINSHKEEGTRARYTSAPRNHTEQVKQDFYEQYEKLCATRGLVDFGELLLRNVELWVENDAILRNYQDRFTQLLVDEFQDTNTIQYAWLKILAGQNNPKGLTADVMVVGDDDQSIYGWRGAKIGNIRDFDTDFPGAKLVRLEQNYRSTKTILGAANDLIARNTSRMGKTLWTEAERGDQIQVYEAIDESDEARFVVSSITEWNEDDGARSLADAAVLYRTNAQSRVLEEQLVAEHVPYRIYGGTRFYDRVEIRNAMAYMRLIQDRFTDVAFERVVNVPPRRIGNRTMEKLREVTQQHGGSLWQAAEKLVRDNALATITAKNLIGFMRLIDDMTSAAEDQDLGMIATACVEETGLLEYHRNEKGEAGITRVENLQELVNAANSFDSAKAVTNAMLDPTTNANRETRALLADFLDSAVLDSGDYQADSGPCVNLMTLHSAKGLEFPLVFITGMEAGLFPSMSSESDLARQEEERRLAYVGITRSMRELYLTYARSRMQWGTRRSQIPSPFLGEIPDKYLSEVRSLRPRTQKSGASSDFWGPLRQRRQPQASVSAVQKDNEFAIGETVVHGVFGEGLIIDSRGSGPRCQIQISFDSGETKWLIANATQLQRVET